VEVAAAQIDRLVDERGVPILRVPAEDCVRHATRLADEASAGCLEGEPRGAQGLGRPRSKSEARKVLVLERRPAGEENNDDRCDGARRLAKTPQRDDESRSAERSGVGQQLQVLDEHSGQGEREERCRESRDRDGG
jgi:hypothetical protein